MSLSFSPYRKCNSPRVGREYTEDINKNPKAKFKDTMAAVKTNSSQCAVTYTKQENDIQNFGKNIQHTKKKTLPKLDHFNSKSKMVANVGRLVMGHPQLALRVLSSCFIHTRDTTFRRQKGVPDIYATLRPPRAQCWRMVRAGLMMIWQPGHVTYPQTHSMWRGSNNEINSGNWSLCLKWSSSMVGCASVVKRWSGLQLA